MTTKTKREYKATISGAYLTEHKGRHIRVEKTDAGWHAQTVIREGVFFVPAGYAERLEDISKTRAAAVDTVAFLIDEGF